MHLFGPLLLLSLLIPGLLASVITCPTGCDKVFQSLFTDCSLEKAEEALKQLDSPCAHFYRYFISSYYHLDGKSALKSLLISLDSECEVKDLARMVYASKIDGKYGLLGTAQESGEYFRDLAEKVFKTFFTQKLVLFAKWEFEHLEKEGENKRIIDFIKTLTRGGDASAAENLLSLIKIGHVDAAAHLDFLKASARAGRADAMGILGNMYYYGWGVAQSKMAARHYFAEGAKKNDPDCLNGLGMILAQEKSIGEAKGLLEKASAMGSAAADYNLFLIYEDSKNFLGDLHLLKAAKQEGYLPAVYRHGLNAWKRKEYQASASQFKSIASYSPKILELEKLAVSYCRNQQDKAAFYLSLLLGDLGQTTSYKNALFVLQTRQLKIPQVDMLRILIARRVADTGSSQAAICLGNVYYYGQGVPIDRSKAFARYFAASLMGSAEAHYLLGWMYEHGQGVPTNYLQARHLYARMLKTNPSAYLLYVLLLIRLFLKQHRAKIISTFTLLGSFILSTYLLSTLKSFPILSLLTSPFTTTKPTNQDDLLPEPTQPTSQDELADDELGDDELIEADLAEDELSNDVGDELVDDELVEADLGDDLGEDNLCEDELIENELIEADLAEDDLAEDNLCEADLGDELVEADLAEDELNNDLGDELVEADLVEADLADENLADDDLAEDNLEEDIEFSFNDSDNENDLSADEVLDDLITNNNIPNQNEDTTTTTTTSNNPEVDNSNSN
ncbi:SEL1 protein [Nematocida homosporus]|uniref:SEL1 protein n=1 Tax=Nematocida homosporus TaxID=1912981 RepID=UPI00221F8959|nr:SEL1 protein [Nematocida homosporus]KAI5185885.1 SEL1 protein [Nematocida homosporus]